MARKSRKESAAVTSAAAEVKGYKTAIYVRLSREDERKIASESVENQLEFLKDFVSKDSSLVLVGEYVDRHVTGTKFDRPEFNRMIADIRSGKIDCVVVKDLSRLGRNYLEAGDYIEKIFPFFGVRFIAVTDNYDSLTSNPTEDGLVVPLKNLINEAYAKDISKKICTSFENQFKQGIFFATTAAYGYKKDPEDSHMVLVDEDVKDIVVRIFTEYTTGKSLSQVARDLNNDGIPAPSVYWQEKDVIHKKKYSSVWEPKQIKHILVNPIYIGDVQIAKTQKCYYKGITSQVKRDDGYYVKDHHEPIIDRETFEHAHKLLEAARADYFATRGKYEGIQNERESIFKGILYCGHCGKKMNIYRRTVKLVNGVGHYTTYVCGRATKNNLNDPPKNVKADDLDALVLKLIRQHITVYVDAKDRLKKLNRAPAASRKKAELQKKLADLEARQVKINGFVKNLYEDFTDGVFTEDDYLEMKEGYLKELDAVAAEIGEVQKAIELYMTDYAGDEEMAAAFTKYVGAESISRELVTTFIKKITCYSKTRFEVEYTFGDELQKLLNLVEQRGADVG